MTITRVGTNAKYADGWDSAFSGRKSAKAATPKKSAKPAAKKKAAPKKSGKKAKK